MLTEPTEQISFIYARWRNSSVVRSSPGTTTKFPTFLKLRTWLLSNWASGATLLKDREDTLSVREGICLSCCKCSKARESKQKSTFILKEFGRLDLATGVTNERSHVYESYCVLLRKKCYLFFLSSLLKVAKPLREVFYTTFNLFFSWILQILKLSRSVLRMNESSLDCMNWRTWVLYS